MITSTVFKTNRTQAVRLPKSVALPDHVKKVDIVKQGNARIITPAGSSWEEFLASPGIDDDFLSERKQPSAQTRRDI